MTEGFASTAAQTLPIFFLAAAFEFQVTWRDRRPKILSGWMDFKSSLKEEHVPGDPDAPHVVVFAYVLSLITWVVVVVWGIQAELICLDYLRGVSVRSDADSTVYGALIASFILLGIMPILSVFAELWLSANRWAVTRRASRSAQSAGNDV